MASHEALYRYAWIMAADVEPGDGFTSQHPDWNRDIFDGFRDYVENLGSDDPTNCNFSNTSGEVFQVMVYSAAGVWNATNFNPRPLTNTPVWTYEDNCFTAGFPGSYNPAGSVDASWFGSSNYNYVWQFLHDCTGAGGNDYDIAQEPMYLPYYPYTLGN